VAPFTVDAIVAYLDQHPEVRALNAAYAGQSWMQNHAAELRTLCGHATGAALEAP
jgi:hypothetical protein